MFASPFDTRRIGVEPLHEIAIIDPQCRRQAAVATTKMNNQATRYTAISQDLLSLFAGRTLPRWLRSLGCQGCQEHKRQGN